MQHWLWRVWHGLCRVRETDTDDEGGWTLRLSLYASALLLPWPLLGWVHPIAAGIAAVAGIVIWLWWSAPRRGRNAAPLALAMSLILLFANSFAILGALGFGR